MIYAKFTDDGLLDWTSSVPQDGLVAVDLPAAGEGDEIRLGKDGKVTFTRAAAVHESPPEEDGFTGILDDLVCSAFFWALHNLPVPDNAEKGVIDEAAVLIPCYGKAAFVRETVESAVAQTKRAAEIRVLLMDEASQAMQAELESLGENVVCEVSERRDVVSARNYLAQECRYGWFCFLDADDILEPDFLEKITEARADFTACSCGFISGGGKSDAPDIFHGNLTGVFRRDAFLELGGLDPAFAECGREDTEFILRAIFSGKSFRVESGTRYWIRREEQNPEWKASSFTQRDDFWNSRGKAAGMILEKYREDFTGRTRIAVRKRDILLKRYITDGNPEHLYYLLKDSEWCRIKIRNFLLQKDIFSVGEFPGRSFSDAPVFTGDFSQWRFLNCVPSAAQKAFIRERYAGRKFDVLFLDLPFDGRRPSFADLLCGTDRAMVHNSAVFHETSGYAFRAEVYRRLFCIHAPVFSPEGNTASFTPEDLSWEDIRTVAACSGGNKAADFACFDYRTYEEKYGIPYMQIVTFELNKECNRNCSYCTQARGRPFPHYDDGEIFSRFDKMLTHLEKITGGRVLPQIMGGEPTIWSDALIRRILARLSGYPQISVITNHDNKNSAWEESGKVWFYTHIVDWAGRGKVQFAQNESGMIVVTKKDLPNLEEFVRANTGNRINIDAYIGEDISLALSGEDRRKIAEIERKYLDTDGAILASVETGYKSIVPPAECIGKMNIWRADCTHMTLCPCCGRNQRLYPYEEFTGQRPCPEDCGDCTVLYRFGD